MELKAQLSDYRQRAQEFWRHGIWSTERSAREGSLLRQILVMAARSLYIVVTGFSTERIKLRAAALTYVSLLSLVPALAVVFSLFAAFGGLEDTRDRLHTVIADALAVSQREKVMEYLNTFVNRAHAGRVGGVGVAVLFFTVISLFTNIEKAFNDIWGVRQERSLLQRFQIFFPLVTLGPLLLGISLSTTAAVEASDTVQMLQRRAPGFSLLTRLGPLVLTWTFFTLLYQVVPNTKVRLRYAIIGGIVAGSLWVLAQKLYALYAARAITYSAIYGSLGAVPLFIIWIYVSWAVALLGAALTFATQSARTYDPEHERSLSPLEREIVAVRLVAAVSDRFVRGGGPAEEQALLDALSVPPRAARKVLGQLASAGLLIEATRSIDSDPGYVPGRPLEAISVADVVRVVRRSEGDGQSIIREDDSVGRSVVDHLERADASMSEALASKSFKDLIAS